MSSDELLRKFLRLTLREEVSPEQMESLIDRYIEIDDWVELPTSALKELLEEFCKPDSDTP